MPAEPTDVDAHQHGELGRLRAVRRLLGPPIKAGPATPFGLGDGTKSLTRQSDTDNPSVDFVLACPSPAGHNTRRSASTTTTTSTCRRTGRSTTSPCRTPIYAWRWLRRHGRRQRRAARCGRAVAARPRCPPATAATESLALRQRRRSLPRWRSECTLGFESRRAAASKPPLTSCGRRVIADGDKISDAHRGLLLQQQSRMRTTLTATRRGGSARWL